ncbi:hypothetical protein [Aromatoleum bremense]|uniref:Uncharacterized protein n=1 Tax=Aromatoleum bremense TaxID=76115 RepID=A0ABX1NY41_9RHOO|nr:hypothetical protein [Aromatoleum bremense]NMG16965.1 hypothetical protein [Aromatoleum bremense]QTQ33243.1 Uncharacterized protein pbN1_32570 [Aromatoleum bremense]
MLRLFVHDDAEDDLEDLWDQEPEAAARLTVFLEELEGNEDLLDRLSQHDYGAHRGADFHVSKWLEQWKKGKDVWRLKVWDLEDKGMRYRIVYAFLPRKGQYHVLGIVPREFDYDPGHKISRRILAAYENL